VLAEAGVHVEEEDALLFEVGLQLVVDDLGLVLGADAGEVLLLRLGDAQLVPGVLDLGGQVLPRVGLLLRGLDVVVDVLEVDPREVGSPRRHGPRKEVVEALVPELAHPVGLGLVLRDRLDDLVRDTPARLEEVVLRVVGVREPVLVVGADAADDLGLTHGHASHLQATDSFVPGGTVELEDATEPCDTSLSSRDRIASGPILMSSLVLVTMGTPPWPSLWARGRGRPLGRPLAYSAIDYLGSAPICFMSVSESKYWRLDLILFPSKV
jgi:hypothetical protein